MAKNIYTGEITKKDMWTLFWRGMLLQLSWNFERMQGLGYAYCVLPILKKLYKDNPEGLKKAVKRNMEFFNTTAYMALPILGTTIAMEERLAKEGDIEESTISSVKVSLMGPLAGIGDSMFWNTLIPICAGIGISLSTGGSLIGPIVFLILYNIFTTAVRWFGVTKGYELGTGIIEKMSSGVMQRLTQAATIIGLMVVGVMVATNVNVPIALTFGPANKPLLDVINGIMPKILPLTFSWVTYKLMKKGVDATWILLGIIGICVVGAAFGIF